MLATTATGGTASPAQTTVSLDGNGLGQTSVTYTTPSTAGVVMVTFDATSGALTAQQSATIAVHGVTSIGYDTSTTLASGDMWGANKALGVRIMSPPGAPFTVEEVGFWAFGVAAGTHARWAIYTDPNSAMTPSVPVNQVAMIGSGPVTNGRNIYALTAPVSLNAGQYYWLIGVFDGAVTIPYNGGSNILTGFTSPFAFTMAFPGTWSATFLTNAVADSYFLRGAQ